ncbi:hypothetical protein [Leadbettera azotonutricia]|uniref:Putative lipoprotein n=1 Tax=Leadbettera azotonutricia (strain ATCC BAA-888 / DSM 13862 / ZAS-9) TaxID=545695 RepID=F5Y758_LEAAZ|nr:hypothetical protein [Leadbettera azotonutricia]AEF80479.1 putative lipoprotein [Leadbettera azotonutricia ZAS-9]
MKLVLIMFLSIAFFISCGSASNYVAHPETPPEEESVVVSGILIVNPQPVKDLYPAADSDAVMRNNTLSYKCYYFSMNDFDYEYPGNNRINYQLITDSDIAGHARLEAYPGKYLIYIEAYNRIEQNPVAWGLALTEAITGEVAVVTVEMLNAAALTPEEDVLAEYVYDPSLFVGKGLSGAVLSFLYYGDAWTMGWGPMVSGVDLLAAEEDGNTGKVSLEPGIYMISYVLSQSVSSYYEGRLNNIIYVYPEQKIESVINTENIYSLVYDDLKLIWGNLDIIIPNFGYTINEAYVSADPETVNASVVIKNPPTKNFPWQMLVPVDTEIIDFSIYLSLFDSKGTEKLLSKNYPALDVNTPPNMDIRVITGFLTVIPPSYGYALSNIYINTDPEGMNSTAEVINPARGLNVWEAVVPADAQTIDLTVTAILKDSAEVEKWLVKPYPQLSLNSPLSLSIKIISGTLDLSVPAGYAVTEVFVGADPEGSNSATQVMEPKLGRNEWEMVVPADFTRGDFTLSLVLTDLDGVEKWVNRSWENINALYSVPLDIKVISGMLDFAVTSSGGYTVDYVVIGADPDGINVSTGFESPSPGKYRWELTLPMNMNETDISVFVQVHNRSGEETWLSRSFGKPDISKPFDLQVSVIMVSGYDDLKGRVVVWGDSGLATGIAGETFSGQIVSNPSSSFIFKPGSLKLVKSSDGSTIVVIPDADIGENGEFKFVLPNSDTKVVCEFIDEKTR